ncbi:MAG: class II glutamine amidotransferase [Candidatus Berkelbacteria bacterium]|nr:class II glutamine amidotransferase [Candidatus Berkelbacteria bacterium]
MCGIVGFISKNKKGLFGYHLDVFEEMLLCDSVRGKDSTGAFIVLNNSQAKIIKVATNPSYLFETKQWQTFREVAVRSGHILVGHNRKATFGNITRENAHPFVEGNTILVHNGTIMDHKKLADVEVDSHAICHQISKEGYQNTLKDLKGAFTLVWYDIIQKKLYMSRNDERPLAWCENEDFVAFASEGYMLNWILKRHDLKVNKIELIPANRIIGLSFSPFKIEQEDIKPPSPPNVLSLPFNSSTSTVVNPEPNDKFLKILGDYPKGSNIVFLPESVAADNGRCRLIGKAYLPGKPIINKAVAFLPMNSDEIDAADYIREEKLICKIRNIIYTNDQNIVIYLDNIHTSVSLELWNNKNIPKWEWEYLVEHINCTKCNQKLIEADVQLTSVEKNATGFNVTCSECLTNEFQAWPPTTTGVIQVA